MIRISPFHAIQGYKTNRCSFNSAKKYLGRCYELLRWDSYDALREMRPAIFYGMVYYASEIEDENVAYSKSPDL